MGMSEVEEGACGWTRAVHFGRRYFGEEEEWRCYGWWGSGVGETWGEATSSVMLVPGCLPFVPRRHRITTAVPRLVLSTLLILDLSDFRYEFTFGEFCCLSLSPPANTPANE